MTTLLYGRSDTYDAALAETKLSAAYVTAMSDAWCAARQPITENTLQMHAMHRPNITAGYIARSEEVCRNNDGPQAKRTKRTVFIYCALHAAASPLAAVARTPIDNVQAEAGKPYQRLPMICALGETRNQPTGGGGAAARHRDAT